MLKQGRLFWFKDPAVTQASIPRGVIPITSCLAVKAPRTCSTASSPSSSQTPVEASGDDSTLPYKHIWKAKIPPKIKVSVCLTENKAMLTKDNMIKRN
jgi:hypothetical protein